MAGSLAHITAADVRSAQVVLDAWVDSLTGRTDGTVVTTAAALELRGILAAQFSDVRHSGYLEGVQRGRREAGQAVRAALEGEGL